MATGEAPARQNILRFGEFELDLSRQALWRRGIRLKLQNQPCQVLTLLIRRAPEVVSRDEIRQHVWGNEAYIDTERSINFCVRLVKDFVPPAAGFEVVDDGIYYVGCTPTGQPRAFRFYSFASGQSVDIAPTPPNYAGDLAVTPDRRRLAYTTAARGRQDLVQLDLN